MSSNFDIILLHIFLKILIQRQKYSGKIFWKNILEKYSGNISK